MNTLILVLTMGFSAFSQGIVDPNIKIPKHGLSAKPVEGVVGPQSSVPSVQDSASGFSAVSAGIAGRTDEYYGDDPFEIDSDGDGICDRTIKDSVFSSGGKTTNCKLGSFVGREMVIKTPTGANTSASTRSHTLGYQVIEGGSPDGINFSGSVGVTRLKIKGQQSETMPSVTLVIKSPPPAGPGEKTPESAYYEKLKDLRDQAAAVRGTPLPAKQAAPVGGAN
jgi:hypothetical protein